MENRINEQAGPRMGTGLSDDAARDAMWGFAADPVRQALAASVRRRARSIAARGGAGGRAHPEADTSGAGREDVQGAIGQPGAFHAAAALLAFELARHDIRLARDQTLADGEMPGGVARPRAEVAVAAAAAAGVLGVWDRALDLAVPENRPDSGGGSADAFFRLADVCAGAEAGASLSFKAARALDQADALGQDLAAVLIARGAATEGPGAEAALAAAGDEAVEYLQLAGLAPARRDLARYQTLAADPLVARARVRALGKVLPPACRLWAGTHATALAAEAAALCGLAAPPGLDYIVAQVAELGGTDRCGTEAAARRDLAHGMTEAIFLAEFQHWIDGLRRVAARRPGTGACTLASAMQLWLWTLAYLERRADEGDVGEEMRALGRSALADALVWLLAGRAQILDLVELQARAGRRGEAAALVALLTDLAHPQMARAAGETGRIAAGLVFGLNRHPAWDAAWCAACYQADDLDALDDLFPGLASSAPAYADVVQADGSHRPKAGPCVRFRGLETFTDLRAKLDGCLTGAWLARERAAWSLRRVRS